MTAVVRLTLTRFRNYRSARLETGPEPVVLTGGNGAGKTNLLEALSFLSPGRGLRRARLDEVELAPRPEGAEGWGVAASLANGSEIGTGSLPGATRDRRLVRIDGRTARGQTARFAWGSVSGAPGGRPFFRCGPLVSIESPPRHRVTARGKRHLYASPFSITETMRRAKATGSAGCSPSTMRA